MRALPWLLLLMLLSGTATAQSQPEFPELTGRVVDRAGMLDPNVEAQLSRMLQAHEEATTEQVVVVTLPDLQGYSIEDYGYQLGRQWGIGQAGDDNGALLIVAREERQVRIEVGYGLEGRLTDAAASTIINQIITPAFRQGNFEAGIQRGTMAMLQVLGGEPLARTDSRTRAVQEKPSLPLASVFFLIMMAIIYFMGGGRGGRGRGRGAFLGGAILGAGMGRGGGGFGGGGFGGGGFGGGGGGFGGGGASGGW